MRLMAKPHGSRSPAKSRLCALLLAVSVALLSRPALPQAQGGGHVEDFVGTVQADDKRVVVADDERGWVAIYRTADAPASVKLLSSPSA